MISALKLSRYFKEPNVPPESIHVLVKLPQGESINLVDPRGWCVAETSPISTATDESELMSLMFLLLSLGIVLMADGVNVGKHR